MEYASRDATMDATGRRTWHLSLRARLMMLVVASVIPLMALILARGYLDYQEDLAGSGRKTLELTRSVSLAIEKELQGRIAVLQVLAHSRSLLDGNLDAFRTEAEAVIAEQFPGANILLLREDGQQVMNTLLPRGERLPVRPTLETIRDVLATGRPAVSNLYVGRVAQRYVISIDVPVRRVDGGIAFILSMNPQIDAFAEVIRRQRLPENWLISIFDREGVNVARSRNPERYVGQKAGAELLDLMLIQREGTFQGTSRDGIQAISAFSHVEPFGWGVAMGVPLAELRAPAIYAAARTLAIGSVVLAIGLALAAVVTRQITRPMAVLQRLAVAANRDEVLRPPATGLREADDVAQALHVAEVRRQRSEAEVLERSKQLETSNAALASEIIVREQAEQKAQAQLGRLNLLHQITRAIGERQDINSIFQVVVRSLEDELPVDFACMCLHDTVDHVLMIVRVGVKSSALAFDMAMPEKARVNIDENGLSRCVQGKLVYEPDIASSELSFPRRLAQGGLRSVVMAPLQVESQVFGVLITGRTHAEAFSSGECEFLRQLSEHVALASHQAQLYGALHQAYEDLRQTQQAVMQQERLRVLGQMASGIAHDINNALSPVTLYTQSLLEMEPNLSARARECLETILRAVEDVAHTVGRMREFYRQRELQLLLAPVQMNDIVRQVVDLTRARWSDMAQQRGTVISVKTELAENLPAIAGVESELREALINLIFNAVDALPSGGTLTIRTVALGRAAGARYDRVLVEVVDDGTGMDEDTRRRALEPFFTTKGERGTGLGLAMVYGVVRRHNAEIDLRSALGGGTTVALTFAVPTEAPAAQALPMADHRSLPRLRLLLIDDDPVLLKSLRDTLEAEGHVIITANDGATGIGVFKDAIGRGETFNAVITDLGMPKVDGRKVASAVKDAAPTMPVIMLTGWGQRLAVEGDIPPYVDYVLSKPPKLRELREALAQCYERSTRERAGDPPDGAALGL